MNLQFGCPIRAARLRPLEWGFLSIPATTSNTFEPAGLHLCEPCAPTRCIGFGTSPIVIAISSGCAWRGSRRSPRFDPLALRRRSRTENVAHQRAAFHDARQDIAWAALQLPPPSHPLPMRIARQGLAARCRTMPAPAAVPQRPEESRESVASRTFKQLRPDFFPGNYVRGVLLEVLNAGIQLGALRVGQSKRVSLQALPHFVQQFCLLGSREVGDLVS